ncbi:MAG: carbonic anhydrase [Xanthomonadales bacterium]|jgi:carbonic anhydrase|nr:carbonic anhydrase [Xanthomonadales bacterium]
MEQIFEGILRFQEDIFPKRKELFEKLASGQQPQALFITCADSRVDPSLVTQADPGELFICRNAGNIVPPHTNHTGGMTASIEFAVAALQVPHIVVCGHTDCGAMKGALAPEGLDALPHVSEWLYHSRAAVQVTNELFGDESKAEQLRRLTEQNVLLQLQHLRTHPYVASALAAGKVELHGWVFDIETGNMLAYDESTDTFEPITQRHVKDTIDNGETVAARS